LFNIPNLGEVIFSSVVTKFLGKMFKILGEIRGTRKMLKMMMTFLSWGDKGYPHYLIIYINIDLT
jgi:hypothetical protein